MLAGHENVTVLNGGMNAWLALDLPTEAIVAVPEPSRYPVHFRMQRLIAEDELKVCIQGPDALLLDARAPERFRGEVEPLDRKAGHIPGAVNRPYGLNLENGLFKTPDVLRSEFETLVAGRSEILLSAFEDEGELVLRVEDDGPGFSTLPPTSGTGLMVAEKLAKMHSNKDRNGSLKLSNDSLLGGACFELRLP